MMSRKTPADLINFPLRCEELTSFYGRFTAIVLTLARFCDQIPQNCC